MSSFLINYVWDHKIRNSSPIDLKISIGTNLGIEIRK